MRDIDRSRSFSPGMHNDRPMSAFVTRVSRGSGIHSGHEINHLSPAYCHIATCNHSLRRCRVRILDLGYTGGFSEYSSF